MIVPVLIHDRQTLDAACLWSGFRNIDDLRVEIAKVASELFINEVGNLVRELP